MAPRISQKIESEDPRYYREWVKSPDLVKFRVTLKETDLLISAEKDLTNHAIEMVWKYRNQIETYIARDPHFKESLAPLSVDPFAPRIVREMADAARRADVGPMAAVAGAVAEFVGRDLLDHSLQVMVENGGDIFLATKVRRKVSIFTEQESLPSRVDFWIDPEKTPLGICTSSGTEGPSFSFGKADAVTVVCPSAALADALATAAGNMVGSGNDISRALDFLKAIPDVMAAAVFANGQMGFWGDLELAERTGLS